MGGTLVWAVVAGTVITIDVALVAALDAVLGDRRRARRHADPPAGGRDDLRPGPWLDLQRGATRARRPPRRPLRRRHRPRGPPRGHARRPGPAARARHRGGVGLQARLRAGRGARPRRWNGLGGHGTRPGRSARCRSGTARRRSAGSSCPPAACGRCCRAATRRCSSTSCARRPWPCAARGWPRTSSSPASSWSWRARTTAVASAATSTTASGRSWAGSRCAWTPRATRSTATPRRPGAWSPSRGRTSPTPGRRPPAGPGACGPGARRPGPAGALDQQAERARLGRPRGHRRSRGRPVAAGRGGGRRLPHRLGGAHQHRARHAGARTPPYAWSGELPALLVEVADDGRGIDPAVTAAGAGYGPSASGPRSSVAAPRSAVRRPAAPGSGRLPMTPDPGRGAPMSERVRVLIADDHPSSATGWRRCSRRSRGRGRGDGRRRRGGGRAGGRARTDVVVMDLQMPVMNGIDATTGSPDPAGRARPGVHDGRRTARSGRDARRGARLPGQGRQPGRGRPRDLDGAGRRAGLRGVARPADRRPPSRVDHPGPLGLPAADRAGAGDPRPDRGGTQQRPDRVRTPCSTSRRRRSATTSRTSSPNCRPPTAPRRSSARATPVSAAADQRRAWVRDGPGTVAAWTLSRSTAASGTSRPAGPAGVVAAGAGRRFVVQRHRASWLTTTCGSDGRRAGELAVPKDHARPGRPAARGASRTTRSSTSTSRASSRPGSTAGAT